MLAKELKEILKIFFTLLQFLCITHVGCWSHGGESRATGSLSGTLVLHHQRFKTRWHRQLSVQQHNTRQPHHQTGPPSDPPCHLFLDERLHHKPASISPNQAPLSLSTRSPWSCFLSPLLYTLYTYDCTPTHPINVISKYVNDTIVVGLIYDGDETEVDNLFCWCSENNLMQNIFKTQRQSLLSLSNKADRRAKGQVWTQATC